MDPCGADFARVDDRGGIEDRPRRLAQLALGDPEHLLLAI